MTRTATVARRGPLSLVIAVLALATLAACGGGSVKPGPMAAGSTGMSDEQHANNAMAGCMKYASQDYCRNHIYGK